MTHYRLGRLAEAIDEFQKSYETCPEPALLYNLAQTYRTMADYKHALYFYRQYKSTAPHIDSDRRQEIDQRIDELQDLLTKESKAQDAPPTGVTGPATEQSRAPLPAPEAAPTTATSQHANHQAAIAAISLLAVGVVGVATGGGVLGHGLAIDPNESGITLADKQNRTSDRNTQTIAGGVVLGVGLAALVGSAVSFGFWRKSKSPSVAIVPSAYGAVAFVGGPL